MNNLEYARLEGRLQGLREALNYCEEYPKGLYPKIRHLETLLSGTTVSDDSQKPRDLIGKWVRTPKNFALLHGEYWVKEKDVFAWIRENENDK